MTFPIGPRSYSVPKRLGILFSVDEQVKPITVKADVRDTANTPTTTLRGGLCLVKNASDLFVRADDAAAPAAEPAAIESSENGDGDWTGAVLDFLVNHGLTISVTLGTITNSQDAADDLNADSVFASELYADVNSGKLRVRTIRGGPSAYVKATADVSTIFGASGQADSGAYPEFVVLHEAVDMLDWDSGNAQAVGIFARGKFDYSELIGTTALFREAMEKLGSLFV